ncbi:MAG: PEP/pyruvate-binding domain-containing protein [Cyanobacteria bacterium J06632_3]
MVLAPSLTTPSTANSSVLTAQSSLSVDSAAMDVFGSVGGSIRPLSTSEAEALHFVSHDKILTWEGLVENVGQSSARVHLIDTERFEGHYGYTKHALGRGAAYTQTNFFNEVQSANTRRYMPFLVFNFRDRPLEWQGKSYRWVLNIRRYNYTDNHQELADMLVDLKKMLSDRLMTNAGEPLLFVYEKQGSFRRPHVNRLQEVQAAGFATITEQEMIGAAGGSLVSVLNPGMAIGYLKRIAVGESADALTPRHIAVFEDTPERIPPVTGIITLEPQTPLSHVNLLAKNRGTPNVSTANISLIPNLERLTGQLVRLSAGADGRVSIVEADIAEAERFWAEQLKNELKVPTITANSLLPVSFATASDADKSLPNIGSKASNYATIQGLLGTDAVRPGFGLSFAHYQKIVNEPETAALIQGLLSQKSTLSPEEINERLAAIRDRIRKHTTDETLAESIAAVRSVITQMPDVPRIRLRSSTNSEDLPTFNGAGLYESTGFNVEDSDKKLRKKLLKVMASLWLERAFWERELFGIDHSAVGMAILINPAFSDEYGNGVVIGSQESNGFRTWVNAQKGEASVTNTVEDEISESFTFIGRSADDVVVQSRSNIGDVFLEEGSSTIQPVLSSQLSQLQSITQRLHDYFVAKQREKGDRRKYGIDIEYKLMEENEQVVLYVKQSRLLNLDYEAAEPNNSIAKAIAKNNGMDGAHLRRQPKQLSALRPDEFCVVKTDSVVGINRYEPVGNGFIKLNITIPSSSCPDFIGPVYVFEKHFNFI